MLIKLHEIIQDNKPKTAGIFILTANYDNNKIFISRTFADHDITKYTSTHKEHSLVYFNRQTAVEAMNTNFKYAGLPLYVERIAISETAKEQAKNTDKIKKIAKNEDRRKMESEERE